MLVEIWGESLAVDVAGNIELGLRGNMVAVIGCIDPIEFISRRGQPEQYKHSIFLVIGIW